MNFNRNLIILLHQYKENISESLSKQLTHSLDKTLWMMVKYELSKYVTIHDTKNT